MIRAHMTKTHKISLLVTLLLAFVALVSAAFILPKSANAAGQTNVDEFVAYMKPFVDMDKTEGATQDKIEKEDFYKKTEGAYDHSSIWMNYFAAKTLYVSVMSAEEKEAAGNLGAAWTAYQQLDAFLAKDYEIYISDLQLYDIAHPADGVGTYKNNKKVQDVKVTRDGDVEQEIPAITGDEKALLDLVTDNWTNLNAALEKMAAIREALDGVQDKIDLIQYFDTDDNTMKPDFTKGDTSARIVIDSKKTIEDAATAVAPYEKAGDTEFINNYADYEEAVKLLKVETDKAATLAQTITDIEVEEKVVYYTKTTDIEAAEATYAAWAIAPHAAIDGSEANHNDLQKFFKTEYAEAYAKLGEMRTYLDEDIGPRIETAISAIAQVKAAKEGGTAKYTPAYHALLTAARTAFDALDEDIKKHDIAELADAEEGDYIITDYYLLVTAEEEYEVWDTDVSNLKDLANEVIQKYLDNSEDVRTRALQVQTRYGALSDEQKAVFRTDHVKGVTVPEGSDWDPTEMGYYEAITYILSKITEAYGQVQDINTRINTLYANGEYDYSNRKTFWALWKEYEDNYQDTDLRIYISNLDKLTAMKADFDAADALVEAWLTAVGAIATQTDKSLAPVTVDNWEAVETAKTAYEAIDKGTYTGKNFKSGEKTPGKVVADLDTYTNANKDTAEKTKWKDNYTLYSQAIGQLDDLKKAFSNETEPKGLKEQMEAIECNANLTITQTTPWIEALGRITDAYKGLLTFNGTTDKTGGNSNQEYFKKTYAEAFANYEKALTYKDRYETESAINKAWKAVGGTSETGTADNVTVVLAQAEAIGEAKDAYDAYVEKYTAEKAATDIRNKDQLDKMWADLQKITAELDAWIVEVIHLVDSDYDATGDVTIDQEIEKLSKGEAQFKGYPLDISAEGDYVALGTEYNTLIGEDDDTAAKVEYLTDAKAFYDFLKTQSDAVIKDLNDKITALQGKTTFTADDMKTIDSMTIIYNQLHESQQKEVHWSDISTAINSNQMVHAFTAMVDTLAKNSKYDTTSEKYTAFTSFTQYYINAAKAIYATLGAAQAHVAESYAKLVKIEEDYNAWMAVEENANNLVDLKAAVEALEKADADFAKELKALTETVTNNKSALDKDIKALQTAIDALKKADEANKTELEGKIAQLTTDIQAQLDDLAAQDKALEDKISSEIAGLEKRLGDKITALEAFQSEATTDIAAAEKAIADIQKALGDINNIQGAIDAMGGKVTEETTQKIAALETKVSGQITDLQNQINELKNSVTNGDKELQGQIDSLQSDVTALMAVLIVVTVITAGLAVCVVLLFIKRKQQK